MHLFKPCSIKVFNSCYPTDSYMLQHLFLICLQVLLSSLLRRLPWLKSAWRDSGLTFPLKLLKLAKVIWYCTSDIWLFNRWNIINVNICNKTQQYFKLFSSDMTQKNDYILLKKCSVKGFFRNQLKSTHNPCLEPMGMALCRLQILERFN